MNAKLLHETQWRPGKREFTFPFVIFQNSVSFKATFHLNIDKIFLAATNAVTD